MAGQIGMVLSAFPPMLIKVLFGLIFTAVAHVLIRCGVRAFRYVFYKLTRHDYHRQLSAKDEAWLGNAAAALEAEKIGLAYPLWMRVLSNGVTVVFVGIVLSILNIFALKFLSPTVPRDAMLWDRADVGFSSVLALLLGMMLFASVVIALAGKSEKLRDFLVFEKGWGFVDQRQRTYDDLMDDLTHQLRLHKVQSLMIYDAGHLSNLIFHRTTPTWIVVTAVFTLLTAVFTIYDPRWHWTVLPDQIENSRYFDLGVKRYGYAQIAEIQRRCRVISKDDVLTGRFDFSLKMDDGILIRLSDDDHANKAQQTRALEYILLKAPPKARTPLTLKRAPIVLKEVSLSECTALLQRADGSISALLLTEAF